MPGLYELGLPLPIWLARYAQMSDEEKRVTKIIWVIVGFHHVNNSDRLTRDIIRGMFETEEDFFNHVSVVFTGDNYIDYQQQWMEELFDRPMGQDVHQCLNFYKNSTQEELLPKIIDIDNPIEQYPLFETSMIEILKSCERNDQRYNSAFVIDQIKDAKDMLD